MGNNKPLHELGDQSPKNGYDRIYSTDTYRDWLVNKRPKKAMAGFVVLLSVDICSIFILLDIGKTLQDAKEVVLFILPIVWVSLRLLFKFIKLIVFVGKNHEGIKKGWQSLKDIFND